MSPRWNHGNTEMPATNIKEQARQIIDGLPETATWEHLIYRLYVREAIEAGISDADAGRVVDVSEVRAEYGLRMAKS
jgi:predicted transcriptional regulator